MHYLLEIHSERKMFQYVINFTLCLIRIISITQGDQEVRSSFTTN